MRNDMQSGYTSLPGAWSRQSQRRKTILTLNDMSIPVVPSVCFLLFLVGLPCWMAGMMMARAGTDSIFSDLHITPQSVDQLKAAVFWSVLLIPPVFVLVLAANAWLEIGSSTGGETATSVSASTYAARSYRINIANWVLLLLAALVMSGSATWLFNMSVTLSAVKSAGGGGWPPSPPWWPPAAAVATPAAPAPAGPYAAVPVEQHLLMQKPGQAISSAAAVQHQQRYRDPTTVLQQGASATSAPQVWLPEGLVEKLQQIVRQLSLAVAGAAMLFLATSWLFGYLAAQGVHAERDFQELMQPRQVAPA